MRSLVWFRGKDLRVADHGPLAEAAAAGEAIPLFVLDPHFFAPERAAAMPHRIQFLLESLAALQANLRHLGSDLLVVPGRSVEVVPRLAALWRVDRVLAHRWTEPFGRRRDERVAAALEVPLELHEGETLAPPGSVATAAGAVHTVFTPFARAFLKTAPVPEPRPAPSSLAPLPVSVEGTVPIPALRDLGLEPNPGVLPGGERAARARLRAFAGGGLAAYAEARNRLDLEGTSRLSQDLKFGTLSVRAAWHACPDPAFRNELLWREFAHHLLWERPELLERPFRPAWEGFPWRDDERAWTAWAEGRTGIPLVDAAARQLRATGFVHGRARMVAAGFLCKQLMLDWRRGEAHYLRWLTDGDWAVNDLNWQWSAGCGVDAQPWFRILNPVAQGARFDPDGAYVRRWVPELAGVEARWIHAPWTAPAAVRRRLDYPEPTVDPALGRARFLETARAWLREGVPT